MSVLSKREEFAKAAMQALITATGGSSGEPDYIEEVIAESAFKMADAMMDHADDNPR